MSVTGPGCAYCNFKGYVSWGDGTFSVKPCDHCGGFSQFTPAHIVDPTVELRARIAELESQLAEANSKLDLIKRVLDGEKPSDKLKL